MADHNLQRGDVFAGRYVVERTLGAGGFATVYDARISDANEGVALKVLHPNASGGYARETVARFQREAAALSRLTSPHAVRLIDYGEADGLLYLATEWLGGQDLSDYLATTSRVDEATAKHILTQLLDALGDAHNHGLLHRDIKPENIRILRKDGDDHFVKLLDFGLARSTDDSHPSVTRTGELIGTPRYMSPEQLKDAPLTAASDIYGLGVVLLEMLLGRDALHGATWGAQLDRLHTGHVIAAPMLERISPPMRVLIQRMTTPHVDDRLATVAAVRHVLAGPRHERPVDEPRFRRAAVVGGLVLTAIVAMIGVLWASDDRDPAPVPGKTMPRPSLVRSEQPAQPDPTVAAEAVPDLGGCEPAPFTGPGELAPDLHAYIPTSLKPGERAPLVMLFHQWDESGEQMLKYTGFMEMAERDRMFLVAPTTADALAPRWDPRAGFDAWTIADRELCVDPERVYLVGQASGGEVVNALACEDWVAGVVTNSFRMKSDESPCGAKPYLMLAARRSPVSPFEGGAGTCTFSEEPKLSVREQEKLWRQHNDCEGEGRLLRDVSVDGNHCFDWNCATRFQSCHLDGGQFWPGTEAGTLYQAFAPDCLTKAPDFPVSEVVWSFLMDLAADSPDE